MDEECSGSEVEAASGTLDNEGHRDGAARV
jgi:hypothetical protein